jgi:hypothetical protein
VRTSKTIEGVIFVVGLLIGAIGAIGQAMILHNLLVHSYPYKMMNVPPAEWYARIGGIGGYVAPAIGIVATLLFFRAKPYLIPAIPVIFCPLLYWLIFETMTLTGPYHGEMMMQDNFDHATGRTAQFEFGYNVLLLIFWGGAIGLGVGTTLALASTAVSKIIHKNTVEPLAQ